MAFLPSLWLDPGLGLDGAGVARGVGAALLRGMGAGALEPEMRPRVVFSPLSVVGHLLAAPWAFFLCMLLFTWLA